MVYSMARMGRLGAILTCVLILAMDVTAGILGIQAEIAQNNETHVRLLIFECKVPSHKAYRYGLAAAILVALSHAIANLFGGCVCICSQDELSRASTNKQLSAAALLLSWIVVAVAFTMLMIGAMANSKSRTTCGFAHRRLLSIGGMLCFVHGVLSVAFCVTSTAMRWEEERFTKRDVGSQPA